MSTEVLVPPLGQTVDTLTLLSWYKQEGETVAQGEPLFVIETDKASLDVESPASGVLRQVTAKPGDQVQVLSALALIVEAEVETKAKVKAEAERASTLTSTLTLASRLFASPRARRLAGQEGIALAALKPTGPEGAIIERDVRAYLAQRSAPLPPDIGGRVGEGESGRTGERPLPRSPTPPLPAQPSGEPLEIVPFSGTRAVIAERMAASHTQTAAVTLTAEADATALVELRRQLAADGIAVSYNDLFLYVLAKALAEHPRLNASLDGDAIKLWPRIDVGLAVDAERGLLVPVVRDVGHKGLAQLAAETAALAARARAGKCTPDELTGSTFTLTNLGMFGIDAFTPIINLPECAILGVGRIKERPALARSERERTPYVTDQSGEIKIVGRQMVWLSLTFDHRLVDGGPAARFLQRVVQLVEKPHLLMA